jgi:uncharacterized coiled-coil DUF342 family protein
MVSTYGYMGVGALAGFIIGCAVVGAIALATDNKLQKARETNSSQKQRLEGLKTEKARNIATLSYQVERIRLQEIQIRKIEPLEGDVRLLQAKVAEQGKRVGQLQNSIETITAERDRLQNSIETLTADRDRLRNSIETLTADRDRLRNSVETLTANRDRLQSSVENITIERDQLHQSTVEARATITQLEPFETEASELRSQVRELEGLLRSRKRKLEEMAIRLQESEEKRERLLSRFDFVNQKMIEQTEVASEMKLRLRKSLSEIESLRGNRDEGGQYTDRLSHTTGYTATVTQDDRKRNGPSLRLPVAPTAADAFERRQPEVAQPVDAGSQDRPFLTREEAEMIIARRLREVGRVGVTRLQLEHLVDQALGQVPQSREQILTRDQAQRIVAQRLKDAGHTTVSRSKLEGLVNQQIERSKQTDREKPATEH